MLYPALSGFLAMVKKIQCFPAASFDRLRMSGFGIIYHERL
jgi:hypothetical protein